MIEFVLNSLYWDAFFGMIIALSVSSYCSLKSVKPNGEAALSYGV